MKRLIAMDGRARAHRRTVGDKHHSADLSYISEISEVDLLPEVFVNELEASWLRKEWKHIYYTYKIRLLLD